MWRHVWVSHRGDDCTRAAGSVLHHAKIMVFVICARNLMRAQEIDDAVDHERYIVKPFLFGREALRDLAQVSAV